MTRRFRDARLLKIGKNKKYAERAQADLEHSDGQKYPCTLQKYPPEAHSFVCFALRTAIVKIQSYQ